MFTTGLSEIVLVVKDVAASARFYREVVGLTLNEAAASDKNWAWFWAGVPGHPQSVAVTQDKDLLFAEKSPLPEGQRWGQVHYAFNVPREKLAEAVEHVRGKGVEVYGPKHFKWMKATAYYFYDPDGNLLEFWSPD